MAEPNNLSAVLSKTAFERESFGVPGKRNKPRLAVAIVAHQYGEFTIGLQYPRTVADELAIPAQEVFQRWCS